MKKYLYLTLVICSLTVVNAVAQRTCGFQQQLDAVELHNPKFAAHIQDMKASLQSRADEYEQRQRSSNRTSSSAAPVPVVFHIVVNTAQYNQMGGLAGVKQRCDSQIAVLNRDFNRGNLDSTQIPSGWKPYFASVGIQFGLAKVDPSGNSCTGYDIHIVSASGFDTGSSVGYEFPDRYATAKHSATGGADAWDVTRYMNVWCIAFADNVHLLGTTIAKSWTPSGGCDTSGGYSCPSDDDQGICINYLSLGKRVSPADLYPDGIYDQGRTLTHETGHLFEIWHVWGDDGGYCPWSGGSDDGLMDTPPQTTSTSGTPIYTVTATGGTITDGCKDSSGVNMQPIGIACLSYLDYTDDAGMHLFTPDQAAVMASMVDRVGGENFDLVRYPELTTGIKIVDPVQFDFAVIPNPASGTVKILYDATGAGLLGTEVIDITGRIVSSLPASHSASGIESVDMSMLSKGIYFVRCTFATGSYTRKILLQ